MKVLSIDYRIVRLKKQMSSGVINADNLELKDNFITTKLEDFSSSDVTEAVDFLSYEIQTFEKISLNSPPTSSPTPNKDIDSGTMIASKKIVSKWINACEALGQLSSENMWFPLLLEMVVMDKLNSKLEYKVRESQRSLKTKTRYLLARLVTTNQRRLLSYKANHIGRYSTRFSLANFFVVAPRAFALGAETLC